MKRAVVVLVGFVAIALLPMGVAPRASASPPNLSAMLLTIHQMPTGWNVSGESVGNGGFLGNVLQPKGIRRTAEAGVSYQRGGSAPDVNEALATFTNASTAYKKIVANLVASKHFSATTLGVKYTVTAGHMSFPTYGNASEAFAVRFAWLGTTFHEDLLIVRKGSIVLAIDEFDLSVNVSQFQGFVKKAIAKLP